MDLNKKRVGVIRGGTGRFYETSLKEGAELISHILHNLSLKFRPVDILIDRGGNWHAGGLPFSVENIPNKADIFWDTTRSDAYISLESFLSKGEQTVANVSGEASSFSEEGRRMLAEHMKKANIRMLRHIIFPVYQKDFDGSIDVYSSRKAKEVFEKFFPPWRIRPFPIARDGEIKLAMTFRELRDMIKKEAENGTSILVEEFISGKHASIHSVRGFRGQEIYVFPPIGLMTAPEKESLLSSFRSLHEYAVGSDYIGADFSLNPKRGAYLTDLEFSPNLKDDSSFNEACQSVGAEMHHVIGHILEQTLL